MFKVILYLLLLVSAINSVLAESTFEGHNKAKTEVWIWSGIAHADNGAPYGFYFSINQFGNHIATVSRVLDIRQKKNVFSYSNDTINNDEQMNGLNWNDGHAFVKYSQINKSWVFGVNTADKQGFNFRVESLKPYSEDSDGVKKFHSLNFYNHLSKRLNGSLSLNSSDLFVTANSVSIQHFWLDDYGYGSKLLDIVCHLDKKGSLYAVKVMGKQSQLFSLVDWFTADGESKAVSQFIQIEKNAKQWAVNIATPKTAFSFNDLSEENIKSLDSTMNYYYGDVFNGDSGMCVLVQLNNKTIEMKAAQPQTDKTSPNLSLS